MNIVLYIMDALRRDFLSCYGFDKNTSPNIDRLAKDGVLYENAYTTATWTKAAAASIVSSQHPRSIRMMHQMDTMPDLENTLPKVLKRNGFQTYAITANAFFSPDFGFSGFDEFLVLQKDPDIVKKGKKAKDMSPDEVKIRRKLGIDKLAVPLSEDIDKKISPIFENPKAANIFITVWSADTHGPYYVKGDKSFFGNSPDDFILEKEVRKCNLDKVKSLYCDMIRYNDEHVGKLIAQLKRRRLYEESLIVVTADHGESFADHSMGGKPIIGHNGIVYEEVIKVPLLIKYPQNKHAGVRSDRPVQLIDIYPTILDACGIRPDIEMEGVSLNPINKKLRRERTIFVESQVAPKSIYSAAVVIGNYKLIVVKTQTRLYLGFNLKRLAGSFLRKLKQASRVQFYDLNSDPEEQGNLHRKKREEVDSFLNTLVEIKARCDAKAARIEKKTNVDIDEHVEEHLKALGYLE